MSEMDLPRRSQPNKVSYYLRRAWVCEYESGGLLSPILILLPIRPVSRKSLTVAGIIVSIHPH